MNRNPTQHPQILRRLRHQQIHHTPPYLLHMLQLPIIFTHNSATHNHHFLHHIFMHFRHPVTYKSAVTYCVNRELINLHLLHSVAHTVRLEPNATVRF
ncbi:hypothetical protein HanRHA438_Chr04g0150931 [Helianthus annuus]|nr:hypothetical protein HanRHA438_Chr04g0150931 [Helianthus annuus]